MVFYVIEYDSGGNVSLREVVRGIAEGVCKRDGIVRIGVWIQERRSLVVSTFHLFC